MFFYGRHRQTYSYNRPVFCEPFLFRLRPRENVDQRLLHYHIEVRPQPTGKKAFLDLEGNETFQVWFDQMTMSLSISTTFVVETTKENPFGFVLDRAALKLPIGLSSEESDLARVYQQPFELCQKVDDFSQAIAQEVSDDTLSFLERLAARLHNDFSYTVRLEGDPYSAEQTLQLRQGSCRDLTVLFNESCRSVGIPARFVSGYAESDPNQGEQSMHAWSEVFLPGAGWMGYDPSLGLAVSDRHVVLATGRTHVTAAPTFGSFRGTGVRSDLCTRIVLRTSDQAPVDFD